LKCIFWSFLCAKPLCNVLLTFCYTYYDLIYKVFWDKNQKICDSHNCNFLSIFVLKTNFSKYTFRIICLHNAKDKSLSKSFQNRDFIRFVFHSILPSSSTFLHCNNIYHFYLKGTSFFLQNEKKKTIDLEWRFMNGAYSDHVLYLKTLNCV
jgi:hypothetical protein